MAKNQQNGLAQNLDSEATKNSQPNKLFIPGARNIPGADPEQPSINNATRREQYAIESQGSTVPESTKIGDYSTTLGWDFYVPKTTTAYPEQTSEKRELKSYYSDLWWKEAMDEINAIFNQKWVNTAAKYFQETYWEAQATALNNAMQAQINLWKAIVEKRWFMWHTSMNADWVKNFAEEVYKAVAYNATHWIPNDINEIAKNTWGTPEEVQAVLTNDAYRLIELTDEYKNREFRQYYRSAEDASLQMEYNWQQYQNNKKYSDYQFESTMNKLERSLFDSERAAKTQWAIYGMTWTRYTLDRIKKQYEEQMNDVTQSYQYQSAQAQLNINYALETYWNTMARLSEEIDYATQDAQKLALQEMTNLNNAVWLSFTQQKQILLQLQSDIDKIKATWLQNVLTQREAWNTELWNQLAQAYGINVPGVGTKRTERNNNPTAMITAKAKQLGWILWEDYEIWDSFVGEDWRTYYTARLIGDPIETTIRLLDRWLEKWLANIFSGWTYASKLWLNNEVRRNATPDEKREIIYNMLAQEWWNMDLMSYYTQKWTTAEWWWEENPTYVDGYTKEYEKYLEGWRDSFKPSTQKTLLSKFWSIENFTANAEAYSEEIIQPQQAKVFQESLDLVVEFNKAWNSLTDRQKKLVKTLWEKSTYVERVRSDKVNNAVNLYRQLMAQWFIQNIIDSKKKWATYWPLSDNEWTEIKNAYSSMKLNAPSYVQGNIDYMIYDLSKAITELWWTPDVTSWKQRDVSYLYQQNQDSFDTPWSMNEWLSWTNSQWAYQSWLVNTWAAPVWQQQ